MLWSMGSLVVKPVRNRLEYPHTYVSHGFAGILIHCVWYPQYRVAFRLFRLFLIIRMHSGHTES